jgi:GNAT superfamily N-acetyltransferase
MNVVSLGPAWPPPVHRPPPHRGEAERLARHRDEIECDRLEAQLDALEDDIRTARVNALRVAAGGLSLPHGHHAPAPPPDGRRFSLRDGTEVLVRPVRDDDPARLQEGFTHLGAVSRYRRFLRPVGRLNPAQLRSLTHVDHRTEEAYAALDPETGRGIGIARYVRDRDDPALAYAAIAVADDWQHRGVGTLLARHLADHARDRGIERFCGRTILGDEAARRLLEQIGDPIETLRGPGTVRITVRLRPSTIAAPAGVAQSVRAAES